MRELFVLGVVALGLGACASPPVISQPLISLDGEFRGPVVAQRGMPISVRYQGYCESRPHRWHHGWYRAYTPAPCETITRRATVRALY